ncbi:E3 ubiquitin-protein ligase TRIM33-like [Cyclospora cayetanensis]|uniref:E3 ubiquitin-protein ligase TRIM33-like n=1 Tax=Cyclospora cayetanensis TaxID=88456 RepID=A0A6P6RX28_9EIME|nr:E3 ubiquitin-protein ligase TRIM33-like [Cyclospora cayetanensis]
MPALCDLPCLSTPGWRSSPWPNPPPSLYAYFGTLNACGGPKTRGGAPPRQEGSFEGVFSAAAVKVGEGDDASTAAAGDGSTVDVAPGGYEFLLPSFLPLTLSPLSQSHQQQEGRSVLLPFSQRRECLRLHVLSLLGAAAAAIAALVHVLPLVHWLLWQLLRLLLWPLFLSRQLKQRPQQQCKQQTHAVHPPGGSSANRASSDGSVVRCMRLHLRQQKTKKQQQEKRATRLPRREAFRNELTLRSSPHETPSQPSSRCSSSRANSPQPCRQQQEQQQQQQQQQEQQQQEQRQRVQQQEQQWWTQYSEWKPSV